MGDESIKHRPWRKRESIVWGIVCGIHLIGLILPAHLANGPRDAEFLESSMAARLIEAHTNTVFLISQIGESSLAGRPFSAWDLLSLGVWLHFVICEWSLVACFLRSCFGRPAHGTRFSKILLIGVAVANTLFVTVGYPLLIGLHLTTGSSLIFDGYGPLASRWLLSLVQTTGNLGLVLWSVSFVVAALGLGVGRRRLTTQNLRNPT